MVTDIYYNYIKYFASNNYYHIFQLSTITKQMIMSDETKNVIFKVNSDLKHNFKQACLNNKETQTDAMNRLVKHYVDTNGKLQKK